MKIKSVRPYTRKLPLVKPYTIAYHTFSDAELVFLEIQLENGIVGMGSASPAAFVVGEDAGQTMENLGSAFVRDITGKDIRNFQQIIYDSRQHFHRLPGTQAAVDLALHDAFCQWLGIPVVDFYGRKVNGLPTSVTIGIKDVRETLQEAEAYISSGFRILKVKTGIQVTEDMERVIKLRERFGEHIRIRVDANQGYSLADLRKFINGTRNMGLELIEQPLPAGREAELLELDESDRLYLAGDESIKDAGAALEYSSRPQPFHIYNIKLMKCGGITGALEIAQVARLADIDLFWGCNDESIVSITAALHVAYACPHTRYLDLDGSFDLIENSVSGGFILKDGHLFIGDQPGFGITRI
ncbi:MAG TPA: dipeptide epimerase [Puia sp.]|nr:dipeptide epimerase [Puia sp.]